METKVRFSGVTNTDIIHIYNTHMLIAQAYHFQSQINLSAENVFIGALFLCNQIEPSHTLSHTTECGEMKSKALKIVAKFFQLFCFLACCRWKNKMHFYAINHHVNVQLTFSFFHTNAIVFSVHFL